MLRICSAKDSNICLQCWGWENRFKTTIAGKHVILTLVGTLVRTHGGADEHGTGSMTYDAQVNPTPLLVARYTSIALYLV